jgi:hypothetical protein
VAPEYLQDKVPHVQHGAIGIKVEVKNSAVKPSLTVEVEDTGSETRVDVPNIVTAVLASYRGYDTLGETVVIFTAGIGVLLLLRGRRREPGGEESA